MPARPRPTRRTFGFFGALSRGTEVYIRAGLGVNVGGWGERADGAGAPHIGGKASWGWAAEGAARETMYKGAS